MIEDQTLDDKLDELKMRLSEILSRQLSDEEHELRIIDRHLQEATDEVQIRNLRRRKTQLLEGKYGQAV